MAILLALFAIIYFSDNNDTNMSKIKTVLPIDTLPNIEKDFLAIIDGYYVYANDIDNPVQYYTLLNQRTSLIKDLIPNRRITEWGGRISQIKTDVVLTNFKKKKKEGIVLIVEISSYPNVSLIFTADATNITLSKQISSLQIGDIVTVSGYLVEIKGFYTNKKDMLMKPMFEASLDYVKKGFKKFTVSENNRESIENNFKNPDETAFDKTSDAYKEMFWFGDTKQDKILKEKYFNGQLTRAEVWNYCESITNYTFSMNNCIDVYHAHHEYAFDPYDIPEINKISQRQTEEISIELCGKKVCASKKEIEKHLKLKDKKLKDYIYCNRYGGCSIGNYYIADGEDVKTVVNKIIEKRK